MEPEQYLAAAALLNPQRATASGSSSARGAKNAAALKLFPRLPSSLSDPARLRTGLGLHLYRPVTAALRGNALVVSGDSSELAFDVRSVREIAARGRRLVEVRGPDEHVAVLDFADDRRPHWLAQLRHVAGLPHLSDFHIVRAIGKGGGGNIFLVRARRPGRRASVASDSRAHRPPRRAAAGPYLAMKVIQKYNAFHSDTSLQHTLDERLSLELASDHPFIVTLRHAFQTERALYLITDFCEGGDLRGLLNRQPHYRLPEKKAKLLFAQIVLALEHLHSLNVMHRDIKAENVLLDADGNVQLADLGLSKVLNTGRFGRTKSFCGTTGYMSPEVLRRSSPYGIATDLWSLGVLFYRVLVGRMPFADSSDKPPTPGTEEIETRRRILQDAVAMPSSSSGLLSPAARELLSGLLEKDESKRLNLEEVKESRFFENFDFDQALADGRRAAMKRDQEFLDVSSESEEESPASLLSNFELASLRDVDVVADELRQLQMQGQETGGRADSSSSHGKKRSAKSLLKRVASGSMKRRPSETSVIGFAYSSS